MCLQTHASAGGSVSSEELNHCSITLAFTLLLIDFYREGYELGVPQGRTLRPPTFFEITVSKVTLVLKNCETLFIYFIYLSIDLLIYLFIHLFIYYLFIYLSVHLRIYSFILFISFYLFIYLFYSFIYLFISSNSSF